MELIQKIQEFVKNGGRLRAGVEPRRGEPFYAEYMEKKIKSLYKPGDKIQIIAGDTVYVGTLLSAWCNRVSLMVEGKRVWKSKDNVKDILTKRIQADSLIEPKQDNFDIDEVDPNCQFHWKHDAKDDYWNEKTESRKKQRMNDKSEFNAVYPDVSFEDSHVIAISDGCSLYFPYYNKSIEAEVYLVQGNANKIVEIPCKVGTPYQNKNSYHAYNFKKPYHDQCCLYTYLPDCQKKYENVHLVCVWKIKIPIGGRDREIKIVNIDHIEKLEPIVDERNLHIRSMMHVLSLLGEENLFKDMNYALESLMDYESAFLLDCRDDSFIPLKESSMDEKYAFIANMSLHHFQIHELMKTICSDNPSAPFGEIYVNKDDVAEGYYSSSWYESDKRFDFQLLEKEGDNL